MYAFEIKLDIGLGLHPLLHECVCVCVCVCLYVFRQVLRAGIVINLIQLVLLPPGTQLIQRPHIPEEDRSFFLEHPPSRVVKTTKGAEP